jgi:hypothetical protein
MIRTETYTQKNTILDCEGNIFDRLERKYHNVEQFISKLDSFNRDLEINKDSYNINPYADKIERGIYILGKCDSELDIFPNANLALKCSLGKFRAEDLRKQFYRSIDLVDEFDRQLNSEEKALLNICPVYLHFQSHAQNTLFKQILFMEKIEGGISLENTAFGFSDRFCQVFNIPSFEQIKRKHQFGLHLYLDKNKKRQLLKIQTVYLFRRLWNKNIKILSLNQRNILIIRDSNSSQEKYTIIDPVVDFSISPIYNALTYWFCI